MNKKNLELALELRRELHAHPELAGEEVWTKKRLMDFLSAHTSLEIRDRGLWFYAVYHSKSANPKKIAFRADFDALPMDETISLPYGSQIPGVSHKCGHDGHSAILAALAMEIDQDGSENDVYFVFQHGEEIGIGGPEASAVIAENGIEEIYAMHNCPDIEENLVVLKDGAMYCASKGMIIYMHGAPTHASTPELGKNPALAIAEIIRAIPSFIDPSKNKGLVLCTVICVEIGEESFGISASEGKLLLTIRGQYESEMDKLQQNLENITKEQAELYGLQYSFSFHDEFPETFNAPECADKVRAACGRLGVPVYDMPEPIRGSEDFGHYLKLAKGAGFMVGAGDRPQMHTVEYDFNDNIIETSVSVFKELANTTQ
ncbi:MAG: amidohydrolase [Clostridiales bacterium]|jgi:amidohydrolase|nr:amidohydrolase [Clostridiales bacterium]